MSEWVNSVAASGVVRAILHAIVRLSTYANHPDALDAGAALAQIQRALSGNVRYLDGGWENLVVALEGTARQAGAKLFTSSAVAALGPGGSSGRAHAVALTDGSVHEADAIILAAGPEVAHRLTGRTFSVTPIRAACLDLALRGLGRPRALFALGIDQPYYYSVHSQFARLAPEGGALLHVAKYLGAADDTPAPALRAELEAVLDQLQPGFRERIVHAQWLPQMIVSHALCSTTGRPALELGPTTYLAGDWVGGEGMLADAAFASGRSAARRVAAALLTHSEAA